MVNTAFAKSESWSSWLSNLKQEAVADGIDPVFFDQTFRGVTPNRRVIHFDKTQPEKRLTYLKYRNTRADAFRIRLGQSQFKKHKALLTKIGYSYGVDPCLITSFWGMESSYGRFMGGFDVIKSLATLSYDGRRSEFFRNELLLALHILQEGHVSRAKFKGEWAGASGQPQFLPSSWSSFAVDYDNNGRKDIWNNYGDIFASIANYMLKHGYKANQPWSVQVTVPKGFDKDLMGLKIKKSLKKWLALGVKLKTPDKMPKKNLEASLLDPHGGPYFLVCHNFNVIMTYNHSIYYAGTIGYMADRICKRK